MDKFKSSALFIFLFCISTLAFSQEIALGQWREHGAYRKATAVCQGNGKIYCVTQSGVYSYNTSDGSFDRLSKTEGFSDIEANTIGFDASNNTLVIAYKNSNIDLVKDNKIINISDIKRKTILGNKNINNIFFIGNLAYLSCGFGIVVLDTDKEEIRDTYYIGVNGAAINVYDVASDGKNLFAASEKGVFVASLSNPNLANYNNWSKFTELPNGVYNTIAYFNGKVYTNYSLTLTSSAWMSDSIYSYSSSLGWKRVVAIAPNIVKKMRVFENKLVVSNINEVNIYDNNEALVSQFSKFHTKLIYPFDCLLDAGIAWIADNEKGLIKTTVNNAGEKIIPEGPASGSSYRMRIQDSHLWLAPGVINGYNQDGLSMFYKGSWTIITREDVPAMDTIFNFIDIAIDPKDPNRIYASSFGQGIYVFYNGQIETVIKETNSSLANLPHDPKYYNIRPVQTKFDEEGNMWVALSEVLYPLSVRKKSNGTWQKFDFTGWVTKDTKVRKITITQGGQVWLTLPEDGILVYDNSDGKFSQPNAQNTKKIKASEGQGNLPSKSVNVAVEDEDGEVWVGTNTGITVFYSPENIFNGSSNWDAQHILIEQDGHVQVLLETEVITDIKVDGANRKWIGTQNAGVYLMSADGTEQIYHFTAENSPLLSNEITDIAIDDKTGEVFFGTSTGLISFKGDATEGQENFDNVYAYPNPVRPDYKGPIAIKGLMKDVEVKITDITGNLVFQTKANGGQAIWDGKNFKGEKASTGIYLVLSSNEDGSMTNVTKILFVN